ncbi:hypothetical protein DAERI_010317 [Deinococcus aerius]|uniref:Phage holin family protein n=1 Tax=Deinococcus aerius TaxID=200253 RepID=A0A2I9DUT6_9DEIO|nr:phage holin family protein [Deinococcus aerius]GBF04145.1 hypothetical protein DAERI_010317 [Deinococcus aerius]
MQEERKSMGGALVDVFDAALTLVKTEIRALLRQVGNVAKAKGIGVVLLLASVGPLVLGLIFLILAVFYGLIRLGLGPWLAALLIALVAFGLTGALILVGLRRLGTEVPRDEEERRPNRPLTEDEQLEAQYQAEQAAKRQGASSDAAGAVSTQFTPHQSGTQPRTVVNLSTGETRPLGSGSRSSGTLTSSTGSVGGETRHPSSEPGGVQGSMGQGGGVATDTPDQRRNVRSDGLQHTGTAANATAAQMEQDRQRGVVRPGLDSSGFTSGDPGVNASDRGAGIKTPLTERFGESQGTALRGTDAGEVRLPVYEATEDGEPQVYGSGLNKKLDGSETHDAGAGGHGGHDKPDPNIQRPVVLKDAPGIEVSTAPTFQEDMKKEGY